MIIPRERLDFVEGKYLAGEDERDIQRDVAEAFGVTRRAARRYLQRVKARLGEASKGVDPDATRARVEALLLRAYRVAEESDRQDAKAMVLAATRLGELHGVMAPRKIEHSGSITTPDYDDLQRRLAAAAARDGAAAVPDGVGEPPAGGPGDAGPGAG